LEYRSLNIAHAKVVIDRGTEAVLLGSPFEQTYFDSPEHAISFTKRGKKASKGPIHDVSVAVRGPALKDFQGLFNSHWKIAEPTETLPDPPTPDPAVPTDAAEFNSTVQLVLTLDRMFSGTGETDGEKGILEAYLRAIHFAQRFIYIENQYFHHPIVTQAIIDALLANPTLVVILLLNISPDMPYYLRWQRQRLKSIVDALNDQNKKQNTNVDPKTRFRVFSSFSHAATADANSKPRLLDNYLHTKSTIVDNKFAMVGSANLDGASMDAEDYAKSTVTGEVRHTEANVLVYEDTPVDKSAVDALRRRLWSEHLGILDPQGALDVGNTSLDDSPTKNWLTVWSQAADTKLSGLKADKNKVSQVHILPVDFDYGADADDLNIFNLTYKDLYVAGTQNHYALESYLNHTFKQDKTTTLTSKDFDLSPPPNFVFAYEQHT
jgi:phosphatidylserine/phosphatidylglycerophosphate/cardiolipin synthase-like enzyme